MRRRITRRRHTPGQILEKVLDMEALQAECHSMGEIAKRFEVSDQKCIAGET